MEKCNRNESAKGILKMKRLSLMDMVNFKFTVFEYKYQILIV